LRQHQGNVVTGRVQRRKRPFGERGRAGED
jgi:hypothetical protein